MTVDDCLEIIEEYALDLYDHPLDKFMKKEYFYYETYLRWSIDEVKKYLDDHRGKDPIDILEEFKHKMNTFACESKTETSNFIFSVAYDLVTDVIDYILFYE